MPRTIAGTRVFQPRMRVRSGLGVEAGGGDDAGLVDVAGPRAHVAVVVVGGDEDELLAGGDDAVHGGHELDAAVGAAQAEEGAILELVERVGEAATDQGGGVDEEEWISSPAKPRRLVVDDREAGLQAGLDGDLGDQVADLEHLDATLAGEAGDGEVARVNDLGDDVLAAAGGPGRSGRRRGKEEGADDLGVVASGLGGEDDDRAGVLGGDQVQGARWVGVAGADGPARVRPVPRSWVRGPGPSTACRGRRR